MVPLDKQGSLDQPPTTMYRSVIDDSVTYYSSDVPHNFIKSPRNGVFGSFNNNNYDRIDTAQVVVKIDASLPRATWKHGRTGYRKKRLNTLKDSLD